VYAAASEAVADCPADFGVVGGLGVVAHDAGEFGRDTFGRVMEGDEVVYHLFGGHDGG
ncbi:MAG: hypothetical protein HN521_09910, partial [Candidatus Latescibacteria bacterium]|nr:hypothetical protein [Candidatus Latescibacterota bacterium]